MNGVKIKKESKRGSILTRVGILEAVFEQGEECTVRGRVSAGEEKRSSPVQLEKQCGMKMCKIYWASAPECGLMRKAFMIATHVYVWRTTVQCSSSSSFSETSAPEGFCKFTSQETAISSMHTARWEFIGSVSDAAPGIATLLTTT